ncbi:MAG: pyruvate carboxyl transferase subunit, partial [Dehalococcoidia bacterium]|nr:pyruvate carboxyl transferase subunit [Dehalococcoidia bacterium]
DCALAPFALRSSQPAVEPFLATLYGTPRDPGLDLPQLLKLGDMVEAIAPLYRDFLDTTKLAVIDTGVLAHQTPGGMMSNLVAQLREAGALDRIQEVYEELPRTRKDLGYPPLVTPTSQIVGVQAVQNVLFGRYTLVSGQVKDYVYGLYGKPPMPIDPEVQKIALKGYERGEEPITCRPADILDPEMELAADATKEISQTLEDQLIYALYPTTGMRFLRWKYNLEPAPDDVKPKTMEDVKREEELVAKARAGLMVNAPNNEDAPPKGSGSRTFHVYVGEEYYKVDVEAANGRPVVTGISPARRQPAPTRQAAPEPRPRAGSQPPVTTTQSTSVTLKDGEVAIEAPMPGIVIKFTAEVGATVKAGDTVVILEAMKMQQSLASPIDGVVKSLDAEPGSRVVRAQVLAVISRAT